MVLKIFLPESTLVERKIKKAAVETADGSRGFLPLHIDFVTPLAPGILFYQDSTGQDNYVAIDEGILIKQGRQVIVSTRQAVEGKEIGRLDDRIRGRFSISAKKNGYLVGRGPGRGRHVKVIPGAKPNNE